MSDFLIEMWDDPNGFWVQVTFRGVKTERHHALDIEEASVIAQGIVNQLANASQTDPQNPNTQAD